MAFERGHALVIGVGAYKYHPGANVPMAAGDAGELAKVLGDPRRCGYEHVKVLVDEQAGRDALLSALDGLAGLEAEDTLLLFYSGHGALEPGGGYALSAHDSRFADGRITAGSGIAEGELLARLRAVRAKKMILLVNACFSGELSPHLGPEEPAEVESAGLPEATAYAILGSGEGRIIITSSRESQRSWGRAGQPTSFFGQALADGLRGGGLVTPNAGYIGAFGLYEHLYETVKGAAATIKQEQEPELTVLKGVGPFPLALYRGARPSGSFDAQEPLPEELPVRWVAERISRRMFEKRVVYTGGGTYVEGDYITHIHQARDPEEDAARQREKARRAYLEGLHGACQGMRFAAMGGDDNDLADIKLNDIYIELDTTAQVEKEEEPKTKKPADAQEELLEMLGWSGQKERALSVLEAAAGHDKLVLLGAAGSGKSTFAKRLLSWLCCARLNRMDPPPGFEAGRMPVLVTLRHLAQRLVIPDLESLSAKERESKLVQALRDQVLAELRQMDLSAEACAYGPALLEDLEEEPCLLALDGLDEVPPELREVTRQAVLAAVRRYPMARVLVTCRVRSYQGAAVLPNFTAYTLAPLDRPKIRKFCRDWYTVQARNRKIAEDQVDERAGDLISAASNPDLQDMPTNPMLLTSMALLHQRRTRLPRERVKLFEQVVNLLILRWQQERAGKQAASEALLRLLDDEKGLGKVLDRLGYETHCAGDDLPRWKAQQILESRDLLGDPHLAIDFLDYADQRAGLLIGYGGEDGGPAASYGFPHRLLQEYLAGCYLVTGDALANFSRHAGLGENWDLPAQLGIEQLCFNESRQGPHTLLTIASHLCPGDNPDTEQQQRAALWAAQIAVLLGEEFIRQDTRYPHGGEIFLQRARRQIAWLLGGRLPPVELAEAGRVLSRLGDPRAEALTLEAMPFCYVPEGPFRMGEDKATHTVDLPAYWLAQFPVTNAQYGLFVQAKGYQEKRYWTEAIRTGYWKDGLFKGSWENEGRSGPVDFGSVFGLGNHPVVGVSWYEALAFTRWLDELAHANGWLGKDWKVKLPSEAEWEKAARGGLRLPAERHIYPLAQLEGGLLQVSAGNPGKEREYPWNGPFKAEWANTSESGIGATSAVGCFPGGAGPYGCQELSGNVWEWTRSLWKDYPYDPRDRAREDLEAGADTLRVLRGGAWDDSGRNARCAVRGGNYPGTRNDDIGFRLGVLRSFSEL